MSIVGRIDEIKERIEKAALRSGRKASEISLMGVTKMCGEEKIEEAANASLLLFGENRVQEATAKYPALKEKYPMLKVHMIGNLQRNKIKHINGVFDCIQSLERDELIHALGKTLNETGAACKTEAPFPVLLEMHTGEESKAGYPDVDSLCRAAEIVLTYSCLKLSGLMTMAPFTGDSALIRNSFRKLFNARDFLQRRFSREDFSCLSMGMTGDFEIAIEEGSTLVRIGTAIFGNNTESGDKQ